MIEITVYLLINQHLDCIMRSKYTTLNGGEMRSSMLYFCIYIFTLMFFAKPVDMLMAISPWYALMLLALWVAISSGIVHLIHFWPARSKQS